MNHKMTRRSFIKASALGFGSTLIASGLHRSALAAPNANGHFMHGVASGDPLHHAVIIWTRFTPVESGDVSLIWEMAKDQSFTQKVAAGSVQTGPLQDYTVKIDVQDLQPDTIYFYRFQCKNERSPIGQTRTLPEKNLEKLTLAAVSCSNFPAGFFHVYQAIAQQDDIDFILHLGDYIYEYGANGYATGQAQQLNRIPDPTHECISLNDYRRRYQQYRTDRQLQLLHQKKPMIAVWDDHEVADDAWAQGAKNHQDNEGDYFQRRLAALQAYFEWIPIRPAHPIYEIYRRFQFGALVDLFMLETRHIGRTQALSYSRYLLNPELFNHNQFLQDLWDPQRTLLGETQRIWLCEGLQQSNANWQVLGQQVIMNQMHLPLPVILGELAIEQYYRIREAFQIKNRIKQGLALSEQEHAWMKPHAHLLTAENAQLLGMPKVPYNLDAWDGYPQERHTLLKTAKQYDKNLIVLSGDTHNAWGGSLLADPKDHEIAGYEFATPSISSPGLEHYLRLNNWTAHWLARGIQSQVSTLDFVNLNHRGFLTVTFTPESAVAQWHLTKDTKQPVFSECRFDTHNIHVHHKTNGIYNDS